MTKGARRSGEAYALVKVRGLQQILFRDAVRKSYSLKCAFTGMGFQTALEACHIIPWASSTPAQRMDVRNGLLLNSFHHKLFDSDYLTISRDYRIEYDDWTSP